MQGDLMRLWKKRQNAAQSDFSKLIHNFYSGNMYTNNLGYFRNKKTARSKQSPTWRKFAQSGRPDFMILSYNVLLKPTAEKIA
jgi:hypothetical protein